MTGDQWIWGRRPVLEALSAGSADRVLVARGSAPEFLRAVERAAAEAGVYFEVVERQHIEAIAPAESTQGVVATIRRVGLLDAAELVDSLDPKSDAPLLLVLEEIQDPRNLGALIRTAGAAGCDGVIITEHRSASITGLVSKASAGALHHVPVGLVTNMSRLFEMFEKAGIWIVGLSADATQSIFECDLTVPVAIVVGAEGAGLKRLTRERVDIAARIPMRGQVASLNASVAGAIALFESVRQRERSATL
jgi:23S rRNA (guanosine2251-2'-O)-methyltransferase